MKSYAKFFVSCAVMLLICGSQVAIFMPPPPSQMPMGMPAPDMPDTMPAPMPQPTKTKKKAPPKKVPTKKAAPKALPKVVMPKTQITLTEKEPIEITADPKEYEKVKKEALSYIKIIRTQDNKITQQVDKLEDEQQKLDKEIDDFQNKVLPLLGNAQAIVDQVQRYLNRKDSLSPQLTKVQGTLEKIKEKLQDLEKGATEIRTNEQAFATKLQEVSPKGANASLSRIEAEKKLEGIRKGKGDPAKLLDEIKQIHGELKGEAESLATDKNTSNKYLKEITSQRKSVETKASQLRAEATKLKDQIKSIAKTEVAEAEKEEIELIEKVEEVAEEPEIPMQWYEKIAAGLARGFIGLRDYTRDLIGLKKKEIEVLKKEMDLKPTGTAVEQIEQKIKKLEKQKVEALKVQQKLQAIEAEKTELLTKLKEKNIDVKIDGKDKESLGELSKKMAWALIDLMKAGFYTLGRITNKAIEKAARLKKTEPTETTEAKPKKTQPITMPRPAKPPKPTTPPRPGLAKPVGDKPLPPLPPSIAKAIKTPKK